MQTNDLEVDGMTCGAYIESRTILHIQRKT